MKPLLTILLIAMGAPVAAGSDLLTADEFEQLSTGRTLHFSLGGQAYGAEQFLPGRRSIWAFDDGVCQRGVWFPEGERLCFLYEDADQVSCWTFRKRGDGLVARSDGEPGSAIELRLDRVEDEPLACKAPGLGA